MTNLHEELHRLVLRSRWMRWAYRMGIARMSRRDISRMVRLSGRLSAFRPTWQERDTEPEEMMR